MPSQRPSVRAIAILISLSSGLFAGCGVLPVGIDAPTNRAPEVSASPSGVTADFGVANGRSVTISLHPPRNGRLKTQSVVHAWTNSDIYQFDVTLSSNGKNLVALTVLNRAEEGKVTFAHLKAQAIYQVSVVARGNIGGTAPDLVLNQQNPAVGTLDFTGDGDLNDHQTASLTVTLDDVAFDGSGDITIETRDGGFRLVAPVPTASPSTPTDPGTGIFRPNSHR